MRSGELEERVVPLPWPHRAKASFSNPAFFLYSFQQEKIIGDLAGSAEICGHVARMSTCHIIFIYLQFLFSFAIFYFTQVITRRVRKRASR
jgi:hypothetical protein